MDVFPRITGENTGGERALKWIKLQYFDHNSSHISESQRVGIIYDKERISSNCLRKILFKYCTPKGTLGYVQVILIPEVITKNLHGSEINVQTNEVKLPPLFTLATDRQCILLLSVNPQYVLLSSIKFKGYQPSFWKNSERMVTNVILFSFFQIKRITKTEYYPMVE